MNVTSYRVSRGTSFLKNTDSRPAKEATVLSPIFFSSSDLGTREGSESRTIIPTSPVSQIPRIASRISSATTSGGCMISRPDSSMPRVFAQAPSKECSKSKYRTLRGPLSVISASSAALPLLPLAISACRREISS